MQYFVIQVMAESTPLFWNRKGWGSLENAAFYKTRAIAEKRIIEIVLRDLHRDFQTGKHRRTLIQKVNVNYEILNPIA